MNEEYFPGIKLEFRSRNLTGVTFEGLPYGLLVEGDFSLLESFNKHIVVELLVGHCCHSHEKIYVKDILICINDFSEELPSYKNSINKVNQQDESYVSDLIKSFGEF